MLHTFGLVAYHDAEPRILAQQLALAKPVGATPAECMQRNDVQGAE
jgi:hypothetical protein